MSKNLLEVIFYRYLKRFYFIVKNTIRIRSIQSVIFLSFSCVIILTITIVGIMLFSKITSAAEKNASYNTSQIIDQVDLNLQSYIKSMIEISDMINSSLKEYSNVDGNFDKYTLNKILETTYKTRKDIVTLAVSSTDNNILTQIPNNFSIDAGDITKQEWYRKAIEPGKLCISIPHVQRLSYGRHPWVVSLSRSVEYKTDGKLNYGVALVDMNFSVIDELCQRVSLGKRGYIYIINDVGEIIYHPQQQLVFAGLKNENTKEVLKHNTNNYTEIINGEKRLIIIKPVAYTDWKIVGVSYMNEIIVTRKEISSFFLIVTIVSIICVLFVSVFISSRISRPIKRLECSMKKVETGDFDIFLELKGEDEVKQLSRSFNIMTLRIKNLMKQIIDEHESLRKSELKVLQAQINPHFLYNTLDSIVWMAENGKNEGVITMVSALAKLFRISISRGQDIISISDELEHAKNYLIIQKIRYKDKFDFDFKVHQDVLCHKTLKLVLQPLIENAIYHGIDNTYTKGLITVVASIKQEKILIQVIDDGIGMNEKTLMNILNTESKSDMSYGIGVKNVHERIRLFFGSDYGLEYLSELDEGTTVNIWLPLTE
jgi:two-component system, sensor histidine kinase YesM